MPSAPPAMPRMRGLPPPAGPATRDTQPPTSNVAPTLPPPTASPTAPPQKLKSQPPKQSEDLATALDRPGDLNLKGLSLEAALFTISEQWNINIVTGELKGTVNGVFKQAPLREILDAILLSNGYNYRQVGKIKMPFKYTFGWLDGRDAIQLNDVKLNVPIDAAKFGRPTAIEKR